MASCRFVSESKGNGYGPKESENRRICLNQKTLKEWLVRPLQPLVTDRSGLRIERTVGNLRISSLNSLYGFLYFSLNLWKFCRPFPPTPSNPGRIGLACVFDKVWFVFFGCHLKWARPKSERGRRERDSSVRREKSWIVWNFHQRKP